MDFPSGDPPINTVGIEADVELLKDPFVPLENWVGHIVFRMSTNGDLVAARQINCLVPSEPFEDGVLGNGFIGVTILAVFIGDIHERMTHQKWPIFECGF